MNTHGHCFRRLALGVIVGGIGGFVTASADMVREDLPAATHHIRQEVTTLVRQDAEKKRAVVSTTAVETHEALPSTEGVVLLERFEVNGERELPNFTAPPEYEVQKVLRTGTLAQHVGRKITTRLWTSGDAGIVLSFRW